MTVAGAVERGQRKQRILTTSLTKSRNPTRHGAEILLVRFPELPAQRGFFVEKHKNVRNQNTQTSVHRNARRIEQRRLSKNYQQHTDIHGIAHIAVQAADNEKFCRSDRRRRTKAPHRELPCAAEIYAGSPKYGENAHPRQRPVAGSVNVTEQDVRNVHGHKTWHEDGEQQRLQYRSKSRRHENLHFRASGARDSRHDLTVKSNLRKSNETQLQSSRVDPGFRIKRSG